MTMEKRDLLIELGGEELPPKALRKLMDAFRDGIADGLQQQGLQHAGLKGYASPRRLAVIVTQLDAHQADQAIEKRGPALNAAYDASGNPSKAAEGFARSCGVSFDALEKLETEKGSWLVYRSTQKGQPLANLLPAIISNALDKLPIPKRMRWGAHKVQFVRPVHWLVVLFGDDVIPCQVLGQTAGRTTRGHRFQAPAPIELQQPADYLDALAKARVIVDFDQRKATIEQAVAKVSQQHSAHAKVDADLLEEVTALVEWPVPLVGQFEEVFLQVPQEALISTMEGNQKYFPLLDAQGKLLNKFITIANLESPSPEKVIAGNEKVVRPRLSDARFFYETDKKKTLEQHGELLKNVIFEIQLGTVYEKAERVSILAGQIASVIGSNVAWAERAGRLCKADLASGMVGEFPELQGIMGQYYATHEGEPLDVAKALNEQYQPRFAGDAVPSTPTGAAVAIADKIDTLVGILGIGKHPTGDKDPYALRRAAIGVLRIIIEKALPLDLRWLCEKASALHGERLSNANVEKDFLEFMQGRYLAFFQEQGVSTDIVRAVLAVANSQPLDFSRRVQGVRTFKGLPEAEALAAANKRVRNILSKRTEASELPAINTSLLSEGEEQGLYQALQTVQDQLAAAGDDYTARLQTLAQLRNPVDAFFDKVLVNAEDAAVRNNRLSLLSQLQGLFLGIADISELQ